MKNLEVCSIQYQFECKTFFTSKNINILKMRLENGFKKTDIDAKSVCKFFELSL